MRFLLKRDVITRVGYCDQHLLRLEKAGQFPRRVQIGPGRVGWLESEIDEFITGRAALRDAPVAPRRIAPPRRPTATPDGHKDADQ